MFEAFGETCTLAPEGILLGGRKPASVVGVLLSLYALHAGGGPCVEEPFQAFRELPDSAPYVGAFAARTEQALVNHVDRIRDRAARVVEALAGRAAPRETGGDFSFVVRPLPKIALCYIFYEADEDFPASATCLFSNNAQRFMPVDGLADVGEYTSKKILELIASG